MTDSSITSTGTGSAKARSGSGVCIIMAGGRGTRFWPLSRSGCPKQMQALASAESLLRDTFTRVEPLVGAGNVLVITAENLVEATREQLPELPAGNIIGEPVGRNTAPCAVLGLGLADRIAPGRPVALLPADHFIPDEDIFRQQLGEAFARCQEHPGVLTLGIPATRPETGYGYLQAGPAPDAGSNTHVLPGLSFVEKPDLPTAEKYVRDGQYFWNGGIFVWNAAYFQDVTRQHIPRVCALLEPAVQAFGTPAFGEALEAAYADCPADSIDCAVMEKLPAFEILPARFRWSDLGSWDAWGELAPDMGEGNRGNARLLSLDSSGNIIRAPGRLVALLGVQDLIIVDTPDALLVCPKSDAQRIKEIIQRLEEEGRQEYL